MTYIQGTAQPRQPRFDLRKRLDVLRITDDTKANIEVFRPVMFDNLALVVDRFYTHFMGFPEGRKVLQEGRLVPKLKDAQEVHWMRLFSGEFGDDYAASAMAVGRAHLRAGVPPHLYIAGYSFFQCELQTLAHKHFASELAFPSISAAIVRYIALDMDLALSVYMREFVTARLARAAHE